MFLLAIAPRVLAQYQTPTLDGVISVGEYASSSGDWSMTWDADYLYVAKTNVGASSSLVVYVDTDPRPTPIAGSNANGSVSGHPDLAPSPASTTFAPSLPFRADVRAIIGSSVTANLRLRDGTGIWMLTTSDSNDVTAGISGSTHEMRIRWEAVPGVTGVPSSFNWLGYELQPGDANASVTASPMPAANPTGTTTAHPYFFNVASTADGSSTNPFAVRQSTWIITSGANSGAATLRQAITDANADADSARRYVAFLVGTTSTITSSLPPITRTVTVDGSAAVGFTSTPIAVVQGPGSNTATDGLLFISASNCVVRGLVVQGFDAAITFVGGSNNTVAGNWIGLDAAGTSAYANRDGVVAVSSSTNLTIGGATTADRNVISGNVETGVFSDSSVSLFKNYIGTNADGTAAVPNATGIETTTDTAVIGGVGLGNVISGNSTTGVASGGTILGNFIGVAADGTTALANSGPAIELPSLRATIGSAAAPNVIANNTIAVDGSNPGGTSVRFNSIYASSVAALDFIGIVQPTPTVSSASLIGGPLTLTVSATSINASATTQSLQLDLYRADPSNLAIPQPKTYLASSPCYASGSLTNQVWSVGGGYSTSDQLVLMITSFSDGACTVVGDGTSKPTSVFSPTLPASMTTLTTTRPIAGPGSTVTFTATITSAEPNITGTVAFELSDTPIAGCEAVAVSGGTAQCSFAAPAGVPESHPVDATYSGDASHASSAAPTFTLKVVRSFSGTGNFSDTARWTDNQLPGAFEEFLIAGTCTFDDAAPVLQYGAMTLDGSATLNFETGVDWTTVGNLQVSSISANAASTIDMTNGGRLQFSGTFDTADITFHRGIGAVILAGTQSLPSLQYYDLEITGSVTAADAATTIVHHDLVVHASGTFAPSNGTIEMRNGAIENAGTLTFFSLSVPATYTTTAAQSFDVDVTFTVNGTFTPAASVVISGDASTTGSGTFNVTRTTGTNNLSGQYALSLHQFAMKVAFVGTSAQSIGGNTYKDLILDNSAGATLTGNVIIFANGSLTLTSGVMSTGSSIVSMLPTSGSALVVTGGRIDGALRRRIATGTNTYSFPIGTSTASAPVSITANSVTALSNIEVRATAGEHPQVATSGIDSTRNANIYWSVAVVLGANTIGSLDFTPTFGSQFDPGASPTAFVLRKYNNSTASWLAVAATASSTFITTMGLAPDSATLDFVAGQQLLDHYDVAVDPIVYANAAFPVVVTAKDLLGVTVPDSTTVVTMTSNFGPVSFDADGNGTYGDNTKTLANGTFTINAKSTAAETGITITATDANSKTGTSDSFEIATFNAPTGFSATATSTAQVALSWSSVPQATSYEIFRNGALLTSTSSTSHNDNSVAASTSYLYKVRAIGTPGTSPFSDSDAATTIVFTDSSLSGISIKAVHVTQLRTAVNAMRTLAGLGAATFTDSTITPNATLVKAVHITELRNALNAARSTLGLASLTYTDATLTTGATTVKAAHITELRAGTQ